MEKLTEEQADLVSMLVPVHGLIQSVGDGMAELSRCDVNSIFNAASQLYPPGITPNGFKFILKKLQQTNKEIQAAYEAGFPEE